MHAHVLEVWLRHRARREQRRAGLLALGGGLGGGALLLGASSGLAAALLAGAAQLAESASAVLGQSVEVEWHPPLFALLAGGVVFLLFAGNSRDPAEACLAPGELDWRDSVNVGPVLWAVAGLCAQMLYSGPRLCLAGLAAGRRARGWRQMDFERAARLLHELHGHAGRVSLIELAQALPDVDVPVALAELRLLRGVMLLESPLPGASLSRELRRQLGLPPRRADTPAMPAEPEPTAAPPNGRQPVKPPAFRCGECRRKFRLRNLHGGARFDCPLCGAAYRTWADALGHVQVEPCGQDVTADLPPVTVRPLGSHAVLGVPANATPDEIKQAYRRLMKEHHPDRVAGMNQASQALAEERSKEINHAYAQLLGKA